MTSPLIASSSGETCCRRELTPKIQKQVFEMRE